MTDTETGRSGSRQGGHRPQRHRFRAHVRALWRKVNGWPEPEPVVNGLALSDAPSARPLRVLQVLGGCQRMRRLLEIGIYPGAEVEVIGSGRTGPVIVKMGETRLAVGRNVARSVIVEVVAVP